MENIVQEFRDSRCFKKISWTYLATKLFMLWNLGFYVSFLLVYHLFSKTILKLSLKMYFSQNLSFNDDKKIKN